MVDKTDMESLLVALEILSNDYQGYRAIAKDSNEGAWPAVLGLMNQYRKDNSSRVRHLFDEVRELVQTDQPESIVFHSLVEAIHKVRT